MTLNTLNDIQKALDIIYNPSSTNDVRVKAQQFLETIKEDTKGPLYGYQLFQSSTASETVKFFGLNLLEHAIRYRWIDAFTDVDRLQIKRFIVDIIQHLPSIDDINNRSDIVKPYIQEKVVSLCAELAEREWPQQWPEFNLFLKETFKNKPHVAFGILKTIAEDVCVYSNPITMMRREDLRRAMIAIILPHGTDSNLPAEFYHLVGVADGENGWLWVIIEMLKQKLTSINDIYLIVLCIQSIQAFMEWIPVDQLKQLQLIPSFIQLLHFANNNLRLCVCEALSTLFHRSFPKWQDVKEILIDPLVNSTTISIVEQMFMAKESEQDYLIEKLLSQLYCDLMVSQLSKHQKHSLAEQCDFHDFTDRLLLKQFTKFHPSLTINLMATNCWQTLHFKQKLCLSDSTLRELVLICIQKLNKDAYNNEKSWFIMNDFGQELQDFQLAFGLVRNQYLQILKQISLQSVEMGMFTLEHLHQLIPQLRSVNDWDAFQTALTNVINNESPQVPVEEEMIKLILTSINSTSIPLMISKELDALIALIQKHQNNFYFVQSTVNLLFQLLSFKLPGEQPPLVLSEDSLSLRRKVCTCLLKLSMKIKGSEEVRQQLNVGCQQVQSIITLSERAYLYELQLAINVENVQSIFQQCMLELQQIHTELSTNVFEVNVGLRMLSDPSTITDQMWLKSRDCRLKYQYMVSLYRQCLNRCNTIIPGDNPFKSNLHMISSIYFQLIFNYHSVSVVAKPPPANSQNKLYAKEVDNWLRYLGENLYGLFGVFSNIDEFYQIPQLEQLLIDSIFASITQLPLSQLRLLMHHFLRSFLLKCPQSPQFLPQLFTHFNQRFGELWSIEIAGCGDNDEDDSEQLNELRNKRFDIVSTNLPMLEAIVPILISTFGQWKDTKSLIVSCKIFTKLIHNENNNFLIEFMSTNLLKSSLLALNDAYHQHEGHDTLVALITDLYLRLRPIALPALQNTIHSLLPTFDLKEFDEKFASESASTSDLRKIVKTRFAHVVGLPTSELFSRKPVTQGLPQQLIIQKIQRVTENTNDEENSIGLFELFQQ